VGVSNRLTTGAPLSPDKLIASHPDGWGLFLASSAVSKTKNHWVNVKLVRPGSHKGKTNFWLSYCTTGQHFREGKVYHALFAIGGDFTPALDTWVEEQINNWINKGEAVTPTIDSILE